MSRIALLFLPILALPIAFSSPVLAQNAASEADRRVQQAIDTQKEQVDLRRPECRPRSRIPGQIVVCGDAERNEKERLPNRDQTDTARSTNDGLPRAPNVSGLPDCSRGCIRVGKVPAPVYYFDITALPEPPKGSDAEKIADGEIPAP